MSATAPMHHARWHVVFPFFLESVPCNPKTPPRFWSACVTFRVEVSGLALTKMAVHEMIVRFFSVCAVRRPMASVQIFSVAAFFALFLFCFLFFCSVISLVVLRVFFLIIEFSFSVQVYRSSCTSCTASGNWAVEPKTVSHDSRQRPLYYMYSFGWSTNMSKADKN